MSVENRIYNTAREGTDKNPDGLPDVLSKLLVAQSKFETATVVRTQMVPYTSNAFVKNNNAFGYKWVGSIYQEGPGIVSSEGDRYGQYADYTDSVKEMVDWIYRRVSEGKFPADLRNITTAEQYATLLKQSAFYGSSADRYAEGLEFWFGTYTYTGVQNVTGAAVLITAAYLVARQLKKKRK